VLDIHGDAPKKEKNAVGCIGKNRNNELVVKDIF
jgi:hypothetical protein